VLLVVHSRHSSDLRVDGLTPPLRAPPSFGRRSASGADSGTATPSATRSLTCSGPAATASNVTARHVQHDYTSTMYNRRSSYAAVASGSTGNQSSTAPTRSGAFSHLAHGASSTPHNASHHRLSRSIDADSHHAIMSTSWPRGGPLPSYSSQPGHWQGLGGSVQDIPPFFVPSYLRGSKHAEKLHEAHKAKLAAQREYKSTVSSNAASLSTSSSSVNLNKMAPSHRGLSHEIVDEVERRGQVSAD
jgi:hypothetical protein